MKRVLVICLTFLFLCGCNNTKEENNIKDLNNTSNKSIDCEKKDELLKKGAILIDVRTEEEYAVSHLEGSINIPVDEILDGVMALDLKKDDLIIVYCKSGNRSVGAYRELTKYGYENVYDLGALSKCDK